MNMNGINNSEIMNVKLAEKQAKVVAQIDCNLKSLFSARMDNSPFEVNLETDEQVVIQINKLLDLKKQCVKLETFGFVDSATLDDYRIDYKAD